MINQNNDDPLNELRLIAATMVMTVFKEQIEEILKLRNYITSELDRMIHVKGISQDADELRSSVNRLIGIILNKGTYPNE